MEILFGRFFIVVMLGILVFWEFRILSIGLILGDLVFRVGFVMNYFILGRLCSFIGFGFFLDIMI